MARLPEPTKGELLDWDYAKYGFPLRTGPTYVALVLASDPWDYLDYFLRDRLTESKAKEPRAFLEQARDFFQAAEGRRISSRPLLYYYSFLNLAKVLLLIKGRSLPQRPAHGLSLVPVGDKRFDHQKVRVLQSKKRFDIFSELVSVLGGAVAPNQQFRLVQLLQQVVGVHSTWVEVVGKRGSFVPMSIEPLVASKKKRVFARMHLQKPWDNPDVWRSIQKRAGWSQVSVRSPRGTPAPKDVICLETPPIPREGRGYRKSLSKLAGSIKNVGVHALLTRQGYRLYLSDFGTKTPRLPQLASMYATMFYLGAITRYEPQDFDTIVDKKWAWLVGDFVNTQPKQFLYLTACEISGNEVVIPHGQLD